MAQAHQLRHAAAVSHSSDFRTRRARVAGRRTRRLEVLPNVTLGLAASGWRR